eukprot:m.350713 g.350713  ORF g.350713 m.350713 type:complete len:153 (+) comp16159_c0_seq2:2269-2727(+)
MRTPCFVHRTRHIEHDSSRTQLCPDKLTRKPLKEQIADTPTPNAKRSKQQEDLNFSPTERSVARELSKSLLHMAEHTRSHATPAADQPSPELKDVRSNLLKLLDTPKFLNIKLKVMHPSPRDPSPSTKEAQEQRIEMFIQAQTKPILGMSPN